MTQLNADYRGMPRTTDVLSFALQEAEAPSPDGAPLILGDVVISTEQAERQRRGALEQEVVRLMVHGFCHLMGHDHQADEDYALMRAAEERLLAALPGDIAL